MNPDSRGSNGLTTAWVVEDDPDYAETISYVLNHSSGIRCDHVFGSFEALDTFIRTEESLEVPHCILMDIGLPGVSGIDAVRRLKTVLPTVPVVMLTVKDSSHVVKQALAAGAAGYLLKDVALDTIAEAVRMCGRGGVILPPGVAETVLGLLRSEHTTADYELTPREVEIIKLMVDGQAHKQIADVLGISQFTVENHCRAIYHKLDVHSGIQAVTKAMREGLV